MKKILGFLILVIVLVMASGCTQPATTTPVTTTVVTEAPTAVATPVETTAEPTSAATAEPTVAETTAAASETTVAATVTTAVVAETTTIVTAGMTPSTAVTVVHFSNNTFTPSLLMVLPGTRITWKNDDNTVHSVKAAGAIAGKFNSGDIAPNAQWGYDFGDKEGTYEYADGYNPNVTGVIIVKKGESFYGMGTPTTYMTSNATW
jgi:plastocyanin